MCNAFNSNTSAPASQNYNYTICPFFIIILHYDRLEAQCKFYVLGYWTTVAAQNEGKLLQRSFFRVYETSELDLYDFIS